MRLLFKLGFDGVDYPPGISSCCGPTRSSLTPGSGPRPNSPGEAPFKATFERSVSSLIVPLKIRLIWVKTAAITDV
jgi:hypothetical protein